MPPPSHSLSTHPKPTGYECLAIYIRYTYENYGPVRQPHEPAHRNDPEIAARRFQIASKNLLLSASRLPPRRTAETRPHQITFGRRKRRAADRNASARRQNRTCENNEILTFGCPAFRRKSNAQPPFGLVRTRFCQKTFCAIVFARGEYGRKWGAVPTSRSSLGSSERPPVRRRNSLQNSLTQSLKRDVRCAPA